jgi:putative SbcD/Mre11-related phosphoesterase
MAVEPLPGEPTALVDIGQERALVVADYHAGIEAVLRADGVELADGAEERRTRLLDGIAREAPDRLVILGDLGHTIGDPWETERDEIEALFDAVGLPVTLIKGNHDGDIEPVLDAIDHDITVSAGQGLRLGPVGFAHGHTWPSPDVLAAETVCIGHEHPVVRLEDSVGGFRLERIWLRGAINPAPFEEYYGGTLGIEGELVVFPAFNNLSGGTWVNIEGQEFLSPFLPAALDNGDAYLLDGTRLGAYNSI